MSDHFPTLPSPVQAESDSLHSMFKDYMARTEANMAALTAAVQQLTTQPSRLRSAVGIPNEAPAFGQWAPSRASDAGQAPLLVNDIEVSPRRSAGDHSANLAWIAHDGSQPWPSDDPTLHRPLRRVLFPASGPPPTAPASVDHHRQASATTAHPSFNRRDHDRDHHREPDHSPTPRHPDCHRSPSPTIPPYRR